MHDFAPTARAARGKGPRTKRQARRARHRAAVERAAHLRPWRRAAEPPPESVLENGTLAGDPARR